MAKQPDQGWRQQILSTLPTGTGFQRVTPEQTEAIFAELNAPLAQAFAVPSIGDPADQCPGSSSRAKLTTLRQRSMDARATLLPVADELRAARLEKQKAQARRSMLVSHRMRDGYELDENGPQVRDLDDKLTRFDAEIERLGVLVQHREAALHATGMLAQRCENFLKTGRGQLTEAPIIEVADVLRKGERLHDGVERLRLRLRELDADRHRVESAPFPSSDVKQHLRELVEAAATRAVPDASAMIEHNDELGWPQVTQVLPLVAITEKGERIVGSAQGELPDAVGLLCWLLRPQLLKALEALIDGEADDQAALSQKDRQARVIEIARDKLMIERQEAALVWAAQTAGESIEHRSDASPLAVLALAAK
jgi:hypothetical protein